MVSSIKYRPWFPCLNEAGATPPQIDTGEFIERILQSLLALPPVTVYILIGVLCWAEAAFFLGFVTPGELAVVTGGILASHRQLEVGVLLGVVVMATIIGNGTGFYLGYRWGGRVLHWAPLQRFLGPAIAKAQNFMLHHGEWAIVLGRLSTATRITVPFLAGASQVPYRRFLLFDIPASLVWALVWIGLGFFLGASWELIEDLAGTAALLVLILFLLAVIIRWVAARVASNQRRVQAVFRLALRATGTRGLARRLTPGVRWLGRRLDPRVALGLSLTIGFLTLLFAIGAIGLIFSQTQAVEGLALIDFPVLEWMGNTRTDQAVAIARSGLRIFHWPGVFWLAVPLMALVTWRVGWSAALRIGIGVVGAAGGAYFLDRFVLEGHVPRAEYPSVPVAVASVFLVHTTALIYRKMDWGSAVACAGFGFFVLCTVALGTVVAGWAAPSGIALGLALGLAWASTLELAWLAVKPGAIPHAPEPEPESGPDSESESESESETLSGTEPRQ